MNITIKIILLTITLIATPLTTKAEKQNTSDSTAHQMLLEFRKAYIDGDEEIFYDRGNKLIEHLKSQKKFDHQLYYMTLIDFVSFDMNNNHFYRAMRKAKDMVAEMKANRHTEEYYNGSYLMGIIYWYRNNIPLASRFFDQAISEIPKDRRGNLATIYTDYANMITDDNPKKARQLLEKAIEASDNNPYKLTYAITMKAIAALICRDAKTVTDCYNKYVEMKNQNKADDICNMYESHLELAEMTVNGKAEEAFNMCDSLLDGTDRYAIKLAICDYIDDKARAYDIMKEQVKEMDKQNNLIMEDDLNEMSSDLQVLEAKREVQRSWLVRTVLLLLLAIVIILLLAVVVIFRHRSMRRIRQHNAELLQAKEKAEESDRMKTAFIRHISHEIRTPLNILTGFTQVLNTPNMTISDEERRDIMERISSNTRQITQIVDSLLDLSMIESSSDQSSNSTVSILELCAMAIQRSDIDTTADVKFIEQYNTPMELTVTTDPESIIKILRNLLQNAFKFTKKGTVTLCTELQDGNVLFKVIDTGIGVPEDKRNSIFTAFEKADTFREGIGLGLSVARQLAQRMGGDVILAETSSNGSTFILSIPSNKTT